METFAQKINTLIQNAWANQCKKVGGSQGFDGGFYNAHGRGAPYKKPIQEEDEQGIRLKEKMLLGSPT